VCSATIPLPRARDHDTPAREQPQPWHPEDEERTLFLVKATAVLRSNATGAEAAAVVVLDFSLDSQAISQPRNRPPSSVPTSRPSIGT